MWARRWILLCGLAIGGWLVVQTFSPLLARQDADADKPQAPNTPNEERDLNIRYAQAYLKSIEATLAEFVERNQRTPNTIRPAAIQLAQEFVDKARQSLKSAQSDAANDSQIYVIRAEAELRLAEEGLRKAEEVNRRLANTFSPGDMARLTAQRDFAKIKVEKARHLASESSLSNVRFELDELREVVQELQLQEAIRRRGS
jgi:hypothetical protein